MQMLLQALAEQRFQIRGDAPELLEFEVFFDSGSIRALWTANSPDHQVFVSVFGCDKFDDIGAITQNAQDQGAEGIGEDIAQAVLENTVVKKRAKRSYDV